MIIEDVIISDNLKNVFFCCNLSLCKGACCVEGDAGAPLSEEEIGIIEDLSEKILPLMDENAQEMYKNLGCFDYDMSGSMVTPLKSNEECIYMSWENGHTYCIFEKLFNDKQSTFQKPISCHLYPIRIAEEGSFDKLLLHKWSICEEAYEIGKKNNIHLFDFLKVPLIRKYGQTWYNRLMNKCGLDPHKT
ncbi:MAG: DUF3109 family protein [Bacteroidales bacterium]|jgi:hypothetical protein|nr:DUF3109 family protein [Bacteroidales bacterium]